MIYTTIIAFRRFCIHIFGRICDSFALQVSRLIESAHINRTQIFLLTSKIFSTPLTNKIFKGCIKICNSPFLPCMVERRFFMSEPTTFIKLDRNILRWRWYKNPNTFRLFIHLLLNANVTDRDFENITVCRGQLLTSRRSLSASLGISEQSVRTSLEHLKSTNEITVKGFSKYSIITVNSYDKYQKTPGKSTASPPSANHPPTNVQPQYKNDNKEKNYKNDKNTEASLPHRDYSRMSFLLSRNLTRLNLNIPTIIRIKSNVFHVIWLQRESSIAITMRFCFNGLTGFAKRA